MKTVFDLVVPNIFPGFNFRTERSSFSSLAFYASGENLIGYCDFNAL
jgi:hypothetical protein